MSMAGCSTQGRRYTLKSVMARTSLPGRPHEGQQFQTREEIVGWIGTAEEEGSADLCIHAKVMFFCQIEFLRSTVQQRMVVSQFLSKISTIASQIPMIWLWILEILRRIAAHFGLLL